MRGFRTRLLLGAVFAGIAVLSPVASSQAAQRDCQTITTCNFAKGGSYRGCLSSYSCRECKFVRSSCQIGGKTGTCQKLRCGWGA